MNTKPTAPPSFPVVEDIEFNRAKIALDAFGLNGATSVAVRRAAEAFLLEYLATSKDTP